jgi:hypothetical protein
MTPEQLAQMAGTFGPTTTILLYLYFSRAKSAEGESPVQALLKELTEIRERLAAVEAILDERKGK